jgi:hypothetical protein
MAKPRPKPITNPALKTALENLGFQIDVDARKRPPRWDGDSEKTEHCLHIRGKISALLRYVEAIQSSDLPSKISKEEARNDAVEQITDDRTEFKGGSLNDLLRNYQGGIDMRPFKAERERLIKLGFERRLREKLADVAPRRKRVISEHDGDWNYDRRWEIQPFESTRKTLGVGRSIQITCNLAVSCAVSAKKINRFATMVWAISDIIEACGIQTEIICRYFSRDYTREAKVNFLAEFTAKDRETFCTPTTLAAMFNALTWRRTVFSLMEATPDIIGELASYGLGHAVNGDFPVKWVVGEGRLIMNSDTATGDTTQLENEILAAVGHTVKEGVAV